MYLGTSARACGWPAYRSLSVYVFFVHFEIFLLTNNMNKCIISRNVSSQADNSRRLELKFTYTDECQSPADNDHPRRRYSSPGEELVYREMMEQQVRETELRQYWKEVSSYLISYHC